MGLDYLVYICILIIIIFALKDKPKIKYRRLSLTVNDNVTKLHTLYDKDPYLARLFFMNYRQTNSFNIYRVGFFDRGDNNFAIAVFRRLHGISKNNIKYSREKQIYSIVFNKGKYHTLDNTGIRKAISQTTLISIINNEYLSKIPKVYEILMEYSPILKGVIEDYHYNYNTNGYIYHDTTFNTIIKYKLKNVYDALKHIYKLPIEICMKINKDNENIQNKVYFSQNIINYCINISNFNLKLLSRDYLPMFNQTLKFSRITNFKLDASMSYEDLIIHHHTLLYFIEKKQIIEFTKHTLAVNPCYEDILGQEFKIVRDVKEIYYNISKYFNDTLDLINRLSDGTAFCFKKGDYYIVIKVNFKNKFDLIGLYGEEGLQKIITTERVKSIIKTYNNNIDLKQSINQEAINFFDINI